MKKTFSFLRSRHLWIVLVVIVAALVIWFAGSLLSFGGMRPCASPGIRLTLIALIVVAWILWLADWSVSIATVALICLAIWYAFPLMTLAGKPLFAPAMARILAIVGVLLVYTVCMTIRWWRRMRASPSQLRRLLRLGRRDDRTVATSRLMEIERMARMAIAQMKTRRGGLRGWGRLFQNRTYLYDLPWYVVLGSKGAGKTTALLNAGLAFPLDRPLQRALAPDDARALPGWRLTNDAVLIDTAGHYVQHGTSRYSLTAQSSGPSNGGGAADQPVDMNAVRAQADAAEWTGFLRLLRNFRPRLPLNGVLLTINVAALTHADPGVRATESRALRVRLEEMEVAFGIGLPVWLIVTKMDRLPGFAEYFASLAEQDRAQIWGFTLPSRQDEPPQGTILSHCKAELNLLAARLADDVTRLLRDETDARRRNCLVTLPEAFAALTNPLADLIAQVFDGRLANDVPMSSRAMLRGVYLTSACRTGNQVVADRQTLLQRMVSASGMQFSSSRHGGNDAGYFLHHLLSRVVFRESHLARPNPGWEHRAQLQRLLGHSLVWLGAAGLTANLWSGFVTERASLVTLEQNARALAATLAHGDFATAPQRIPVTLDHADELRRAAARLVADSDVALRLGRDRVERIEADGRHAYDVLLTRFVLPWIVRRMEAGIASAVASGDAGTVYDALRVYLMLYDTEKFAAADVETWVLDDWAKHDSAAAFGGRAAMIGHVQRLFSENRVVQPPLTRNDMLVQQARAFLDNGNPADRLYQRAKAAMQKEAPDEFSLLRVIGPQAGVSFTRASGAPLSRGVPGLFTLDGYRAVFDKRLPEFIRTASDDDAWVMGRPTLGDAPTKPAGALNVAGQGDDALSTAIRRQYLMEYAEQWDAFLDDIRVVSGASLAFNLKVLSRLAAPDSPLTRLAHAAAHETTLAQPMTASDGSFLEKATNAFHQKAGKILGLRASERLERELVDSHFAALREIVTGNADAPADTQPAVADAGKSGLGGVTDLLNDYYKTLTISDNALSNNSMPPASETAAKLMMTADTMPSPFRAVLRQLAVEGSRGVNQGMGQLLSRQMQAAVGDPCRLAIEGSYPFTPDSKRDVSIADFTRVFANGGLIDDFFTKMLSPFVDMSVKPWRYRTLPGAIEPVQGPDLAPFEHAKAIRDIFFSDSEGQQFAWKVGIRIPELDPTILRLSLNIDGQSSIYQHGPVAPVDVAWPGPRGGVRAEIVASPGIRADTATIASDGPWALMRLLHKGRVTPTATPGRTRVTFEFDGRKAVLDIRSAGTVANPLTSDVLATFRCPTTMPTFSLTDSGLPPGLPRGEGPTSAMSN